MADEQELKLDAEKATGKVSKKIIIIAVVVILILASTAVALFFVLGTDKSDTANTANTANNSAAVATVEGPIQYHTLGQSFVVNFVTQTRQHYVKLSIDVVTRNPEVISALEHHAPMVRSEVLRIVGEKGFNSLRSIESKLALQQELKEHLAKILKQEADVEGLHAVIFTEFVMQ